MAKRIESDELISIVKAAINEMIETGEKINFFTVAEKAQVSRQFLYNHQETKELIEKYRIITDDNKYEILCKSLKEENKNLLKTIEAYDEQILKVLSETSLSCSE